jgi:hypothetical protein
MKKASSVRFSFVSLVIRCDCNHAAPWLEKIPRALQCLTADGIEHHIDIARAIFETLTATVDHLAGSKA